MVKDKTPRRVFSSGVTSPSTFDTAAPGEKALSAPRRASAENPSADLHNDSDEQLITGDLSEKRKSPKIPPSRAC